MTKPGRVAGLCSETEFTTSPIVAMTITIVVVPATPVADAWSADHGTADTANDRSDRPGHHGARACADRGAGYGAFVIGSVRRRRNSR